MTRAPRETDRTGARLKWKTVIIPFSTLQFWVNFLIVLGVLCAVMIGVYYQFLSPKAQARRLIADTEARFDQAIVMGVKELAFEEYRSVQEGLFQARKNYDDRKYTESLILLEQTTTSLDKAMERLKSDEFFRRERSATFKHLKGDVEIQQAGSLGWQPAKAGTQLKKGDRVRTRSGSQCVVQFDDGSQLTVKSDSLVHIDELSEDVRTRTKNSAINLLVSDVEASILRPTAKGSRFLIKTPGSTAQVNKARMNIRVDKDNQTEYKLISGDVSVNAAGKDVSLGANEVVRLASEGRVVSRGRLLGVPAPQLPENLDWRVSAREKVPVSFVWERVPEAASYHLVVAADRYFANAVYDNAKIRVTGATVKGLEAGIYYWRVSSVDSQGRESLFSPFSVFRLNHDQTPPLLAMSDPIVLQEGQQNKVYLAGAVEPGSTLAVNGRPAPLAPDGTFRMFTDLGANTASLSIRAVDPAGNVLSHVRELR
ncbi:MAG: FecR domain-containing protein [bacterium]|nr:FecR domain-containing protein [bacterium]MDT8396402.1 FecR domain-containing protein [bacterium]